MEGETVHLRLQGENSSRNSLGRVSPQNALFAPPRIHNNRPDDTHPDAAMVLRYQRSQVAPWEAEVPVQDDKALQDRGGEEIASRVVHIQTWQLRVRGGVLPKSIASGQCDSLMAA